MENYSNHNTDETGITQQTNNDNIDNIDNIAKLLVENAISSIPGNTLQKKLDYLALCNCCERHQKNKPKRFRSWIDKNYPTTQFTNCNCDCRHIARFICRQIE